jgi:DNA adenine methylase
MMIAPEAPRRPPIRYHGSKWNLSPWVISHFPEHDCYVEAYGGGGAVLLNKPRSWLEVYNDKDNQVVNFFEVLRERPDELIWAIHWTPFSKTEWGLATETTDDPDRIEMARRFYIRAWQNIAGPTAQWNSGWRRQKVLTRQDGQRRMKPAALSFMETDHLYQVANRFRGVQIECDTALAILKRYDSPETLFYLDPPYPSSTRGRWAGHAYLHEMSDDDHRQLARAAHNLAGFVLVSGYQCELYDELYADWHRRDQQARVNGRGSATESLWLSPRTISALTRPKQLSLGAGI